MKTLLQDIKELQVYLDEVLVAATSGDGGDRLCQVLQMLRDNGDKQNR